jgi:hypothetical protein
LGLRRTGIGPEPKRVATDRADGLAVAPLDLAVDTKATVGRRHRASEHVVAYLAIT